MHEKARKNDRRASRTQRALKDALFLLIQEKHYDEITVQNLIDRANVGRSTFYAHYRDKEDLFRSDWEGFLDGVAHAIQWQKVSEGSRCLPLMEVLSHMLERKVFCMALARSRKIDLLFKSGTTYLAKKMEEGLAAQRASQAAELPTSVTLAVLSNFLASTFFNQMKWWLDNGMSPTPERMDQIFHELVMPGLRAMLQISAAPETNASTQDTAQHTSPIPAANA